MLQFLRSAILYTYHQPQIEKMVSGLEQLKLVFKGAANFHGFLPVMVRNCIISLTSTVANAAAAAAFPQPLATALFSFLYHLASYEAGGEALVSCGMMESLLKVSLFIKISR